MKPIDLTIRSLQHHWRMNLAVALGVAVATAVLTGALLVGDSMRGSLRELTLERLGRIDYLLLSDRFFRQQLAEELAASAGFASENEMAVPAIVIPQISSQATWADPQGGRDRIVRVGQVTLFAIGKNFWRLDDSGVRPTRHPQGDQVVLNEPLATALGARVGDRILLRIPRSNQVPADSPLGRRSNRVRGLTNLEVVDIVPAQGIGRFSFHPTQQLPRNAFVALDRVQMSLDQKARVNTLLIAAKKSAGVVEPEEAARRLGQLLQPRLEDFGYAVNRHSLDFLADGEDKPEVIFDYVQVTSERLVFEPAASEATLDCLEEYRAQPTITYLANRISNLSQRDKVPLPYSIVTGVGNASLIGLGGSEPLEVDVIYLNQWSRGQLSAEIGDLIEIRYFAPERTHGEVREETTTLPVGGIVALTEPSSGFTRPSPAQFADRPTLANDPNFTPVVEGITDRAAIEDWDPPFPFDNGLIQDRDEEYWENHRTTPKAFVSLVTGQRLWASRFGDVTAIRTPMTDEVTVETVSNRLQSALRNVQSEIGFRFRAIKHDGLQAASGTTPFGLLFLGFSFFVIVAALILVGLLFRLSVDLRLREIGTLLANGWSMRQVRRNWMCENAAVAIAGGLAGVIFGVGYAALMLVGLRTWWLEAVVTPFLRLHVNLGSLGIGLVATVAMCLAVITISLSRLRRIPTTRLLAGKGATLTWPGRTGQSRAVALIPPGLLVVALCLAVMATSLKNEARAGAFMGSGFVTLAALLLWIGNRLRQSVRDDRGQSRMSLSVLAKQSAARNPLRSGLTMGMMAMACFLIVAIAAFRLEPTEQGTGGFDLIGQTDRSLYVDLNTDDGRQELFGDDASQLEGSTIVGMRWNRGEDASCRNLFQTSKPQLLGVPLTFAELSPSDDAHGGFAFAGPTATTSDERAAVWSRLFEQPDDEVVPVILDKNTALYALHLGGNMGEEFEFDYGTGQPIRFRIVGLLSNSVLQGRLIISEQHLLRHFPSISGYQFFLIRSPVGASERVAGFLEQRLRDEGFDVEDARQQLEELLNVQNTYLSTFQSLGGLGLLLGTVGLAVVQIRSVIERRGELALLRSVGFSAARIRELVTREQWYLLRTGLLCGVFSAMVAILPHWWLGAAGIPWGQLAMTLAAVVVVGLLTSWWSVRVALRTPVLQTLRGE